MALLMNKSALVTRAVARPSPAKRCMRSVRAQASEEQAPEAAPGTVFYGGKSYTESEWKDALANGIEAAPVAATTNPAVAAAGAPSLTSIMAFSGPGPELANGRLAMLGFVAAVGAELSSGESVLKQWGSEPTLIALTFITFMAASLVPLTRGAKTEAFGPFTPAAEMLNGRAAMIGFAALLGAELVRGGVALF